MRWSYERDIKEVRVTSPLTYEEFIESLRDLAGGQEIALDRSLFEQDNLDSIDVVEWLYALGEQYDLEVGADTVELVSTEPVQNLYYPLIADHHPAEVAGLDPD
jgi:acyl carrier protein